MIILSLYTHHTNSSVSEELMKLIPQDNTTVHLVFIVFANYSLTIKLILVNQHLLHMWSANLSTSNLCTPDTRGRAPTEWFIALIIRSACFGHLYSHHQELVTICVLLPSMVCNTLFAGGRRSGEGQQAIFLEQNPSSRKHSLLRCT